MMSILEGSLDKFTSVLFIFILLIGSTLFTIFFAVQVWKTCIIKYTSFMSDYFDIALFHVI